MTCPYCSNDDRSMLEWTGKLSLKFRRIWLCCVCSREFETPEPPQKGA